MEHISGPFGIWCHFKCRLSAGKLIMDVAAIILPDLFQKGPKQPGGFMVISLLQ
jgi:hypothetical protein